MSSSVVTCNLCFLLLQEGPTLFKGKFSIKLYLRHDIQKTQFQSAYYNQRTISKIYLTVILRFIYLKSTSKACAFKHQHQNINSFYLKFERFISTAVIWCSKSSQSICLQPYSTYQLFQCKSRILPGNHKFHRCGWRLKMVGFQWKCCGFILK